MQLVYTFKIEKADINDFVNHWSQRYFYGNEEKYTNNIGKPLTKQSRNELFEWKNGSKISEAKLKSIEQNYPLVFDGDKEDRYLNHQKSGGAIWNIFYLHCLDQDNWPIFDQHTYRAMKYLKHGKIIEIGTTNKRKYESYSGEYLPFLKALSYDNTRKLDKALFAFGQFLKIAGRYS